MKKVRSRIREAFSVESDRASNEEIRERILSGAQVKGTNLFILMMAIFIASIGLNMNSTAVIIGAMLISPLMGGIMAIGYAMATNDIKLVRKAFIGLVFQIIICIATSALYFKLTPISTAQSELLARTMPTIWDVMIAVFGGLAGIVGVTRKERGNVIPGVAIATALMPPLCTAGYGLATMQPKFFLGAGYLFFINSFFICITTYIMINLMRLPKKSFMDKESEKRVKRMIYAIGLVTIIPSIYLGYQIVADSVEDGNIQRFVEELPFNGTQVVNKYVDKQKDTIKLACIGKTLGSGEIQLLNESLKNYGLGHMTLEITQGEAIQSLGYEEVEQLIQQELYESSSQVALGDRDKEIERLKSELVKYKSQLMEYQNQVYDVETLSKELQALYQSIEKFSLATHETYVTEAGTIEEQVVAIIDVKGILKEEDKIRIKDWIRVKTGKENVALYINIIRQPLADQVPPTGAGMMEDITIE